jgi:hypothetical protein
MVEESQPLADYERRLHKAEAWFAEVQDVISEEKSDAFLRLYSELADRAHAAFPGIRSRLFEFDVDERLRFSRWTPWRYDE